MLFVLDDLLHVLDLFVSLYLTRLHFQANQSSMALNAAGSAANRFKLTDGNLGLLQEYLRRDPESYAEEFAEQFHHFLQSIKLLELQPQMHRMGNPFISYEVVYETGIQPHFIIMFSGVEQLLEVVNFVASVAFNYPGD
jgi:hypothetical protein